MKKKRILVSLLSTMAIVTFASCGGGSGSKKESSSIPSTPSVEQTSGDEDESISEIVITEFKVTFNNYDGTELYSYVANKGDIAEYKGETPERLDGDYFASYVFDGWDKPLSTVEENVVYTATYKVKYSTTYYSNGLLFELSEDQKGWYIRKYLGSDANVVVPSTFDGLPVTAILTGAFCDNDFIKTIHIGANVTYIGENAFLNMTAIEQITVSEMNKVYKVVDDALIGVYKNKDFGYVAKSLIYMPSNRNGFYEIPDDVSIYRGCLSGSKINDLKFSTKVFKPLNVLDNPIADQTNSEYSSYVYKDLFGGTEADVNKSSVIHVIVSGGDIPAGMFSGNTKLESISLYENEVNPISEIGSLAFYGCTSLKSMVIPNSVVTIRKRAYEKCNFKTLAIGRNSDLQLQVVEDYGLFCDVEEKELYNGIEYVGNDENPYILAHSIDSNNTRQQEKVTINANTLFLRDELLKDAYYSGGVTEFNSQAKLRSIGAYSLFNLKKKITLPNTVNFIGYNPIADYTSLDDNNGFYYLTDTSNNKYYVGGSTKDTLAIDEKTKVITTNTYSLVDDVTISSTNRNFKYNTTDKLLYSYDYSKLYFSNTDKADITLKPETVEITSNAFNGSEVETVNAFFLEYIDDFAFSGYKGTEVLEFNFDFSKDNGLIDNRFDNIVYLSNSIFDNTTLTSFNVGNKLGYLGVVSSASKKISALENDDYSVFTTNIDKINFDNKDNYSHFENIYATLGLITTTTVTE